MVLAKWLFQPAPLLGLVMLVFLACQSDPPPPPAVSGPIVCETDELVKKLQAEPPFLNGCSAASIRSADMPALVSAGVTKEQLLAVWSLDGATGFTPAQLHSAGVTVAEMQSAGLTVSEMYTGGVSVADLRTGGVSIDNLRGVGVTTHELHSGGFTIDQMQSAGLTILQIHAGGVSISDLTSSGLTLLQLYNGGISTAQLRSAGATVAEMRMGGLSILQIYVGGVSTAQLKEAGFTIAQMRNAGLTVLQIQAGGFSISDLLSAGFSVFDLYNSGVSVADLNSGGVSIADLRSAGIADHLVFNGACTQSKTCTSRSSGTEVEECSVDHPTITLGLNPAKTRVVLEGNAVGSVTWQLSGTAGTVTFDETNLIGTTEPLGRATAELVGNEDIIVSTLSLPLADIFSNSNRITVTITDGQLVSTNIGLCPARLPSMP